MEEFHRPPWLSGGDREGAVLYLGAPSLESRRPHRLQPQGTCLCAAFSSRWLGGKSPVGPKLPSLALTRQGPGLPSHQARKWGCHFHFVAGQEDACLGQGTSSWRLRVPRSLLMPGRMVVPLGIVFTTDLSRHLLYLGNNPE